MDVSLVYTTDIFVFASMDVDEAKDYIEKYHITKYPYLRVFILLLYNSSIQGVKVKKVIDMKESFKHYISLNSLKKMLECLVMMKMKSYN